MASGCEIFAVCCGHSGVDVRIYPRNSTAYGPCLYDDSRASSLAISPVMSFAWAQEVADTAGVHAGTRSIRYPIMGVAAQSEPLNQNRIAYEMRSSVHRFDVVQPARHTTRAVCMQMVSVISRARAVGTTSPGASFQDQSSTAARTCSHAW